MKKFQPVTFILSILLAASAGAVGSLFTFEAIPTWYADLNKPFFNPPNWIFGPVWTTLYILMGIAFYLVKVSNKKGNKKKAMDLYFIQLMLNAGWSIVFFGLKSPLGAFFVIIALWIAIVMTIKAFVPYSKVAAYLLIPYISWVSFAALLNIFIFFLN